MLPANLPHVVGLRRGAAEGLLDVDPLHSRPGTVRHQAGMLIGIARTDGNELGFGLLEQLTMVLEAPFGLESLHRPLPAGLVRVGHPHHVGTLDPEPDRIEAVSIVPPPGVPDYPYSQGFARGIFGSNQLWQADGGGPAQGKERSSLHPSH